VSDRASLFRGRLFPQSRPHLVCGANGTELSFLMAWQFPDSPTTPRSLLCDRGFCKVRSLRSVLPGVLIRLEEAKCDLCQAGVEGRSRSAGQVVLSCRLDSLAQISACEYSCELIPYQQKE
jgi:hypothetical protein